MELYKMYLRRQNRKIKKLADAFAQEKDGADKGSLIMNIVG